MRSRQPKRRIFPQSFDNFRDEFLYSTGSWLAGGWRQPKAYHFIRPSK
jgi:hypothetical protein